MDNDKKFVEIIVLLSKICELRNTRGSIFKSFDDVLKSLLESDFTNKEFETFLKKLHDRMIKYDSVFRIYGFRAIRYLLIRPELVDIMLSENIHYIVIESFEQESDCLHERMQAIRLIRKCVQISPENMHLGFVRSIVAVASDNGDKFRRLAADTLCDLCIKNPAVVAEANGIRTLFGLVLQPDFVEMVEAIMVSMLYLYNSPETRRYVQLENHLGGIISPYTDYDSAAPDAEKRLKSAGIALMVVMRNWGGLHALSQNEIGLRSLSRLLCDPKVSAQIQDAVLDMISEVLEPVISRTNAYSKPNKLSGLKKLSTKHLVNRMSGSGGVAPPDPPPATEPPPAGVGLSNIKAPLARSASSVVAPGKQSPSAASGTGPAHMSQVPRFNSNGTDKEPRPNSRLSVDDDEDDELSTESGSTNRSRSRSGSYATVPPKPTMMASPSLLTKKDKKASSTTAAAQSSPGSERKEQRRSLKSFFRQGSKSSTSGAADAAGKTPDRSVTGKTTTAASSGDELSPHSIFRAPGPTHRRASDKEFRSKEEVEGQGGRMKSRTIDLGVKGNQFSTSSVSLGFLLNGFDEVDMPTLERTFSIRSADELERPKGDPIYNLMDTYAVMLCVALLKAGTFPSLCTIATLGSAMLSDKARKLLVHLLGVISRLFPDRTCADLLSDPSLIEFASTFASLKLSDRALKASQLLISLSTAFSLSRGRGGYTANAIMNKLGSNQRYTAGLGVAQQGGRLLDSIISVDYGFASLGHKSELSPSISRIPSSSPVSGSIGKATPTDYLASRIREHRITRVVSDILDEVAHTAYARVSRIIGTAAALKHNNPDAFKNRNMRGKSDPIQAFTNRGSFANFMFGEKHGASLGNSSIERNSISSELLATPLKNADRGGQTREDLMYEIKIVVTPLMDRLEFTRQMDASKVVGKEGKEPFKWDWSMVSEMLEYCVRYPERLQEVMKTKWVKRLCGFFRCSTDDKGYFSNLDWYPSNLHYLECACHLYGVLVEQDGMNSNSTQVLPFLGVDRRGMLFAEIVTEIEYVVTLATRIGHSHPVLAIPFSAGHLITNNVSPATSRSVFRLYGCTQLMSREYFTLLGRLCGTDTGRALIEGNQIYGVLSTIGQHACLDYLSRVALTAITFTDEGFMSQHMLQILPVSVGSSDGLKRYSHMLLRSLLRARDHHANSWMVEVVAAQLLYDNMPTDSVIRVLEEIVQDGAYIKLLAKSISLLVGIPGTENILIRLQAVSECSEQLEKAKWTVPNVHKWLHEGGCKSYATKLEETLFDALCVNHRPSALTKKQDYTPIPIACRPYSVHPQAPRRFSWNPDGGADVEGLLRAPWNIECRIGSQPAGQRLSAKEIAPDYVRIDSYLDASDMPSAASGESTSDDLRIVKVRGVIIDEKGLPSAIVVPADKTLSTCLLCGVCPVYRDGRVYADPSQSTAAGHSGSMPGVGVSASGNTVASAAASIMTQRRKYSRSADNGNGGIFNNDRSSNTGTVQENIDPPLTYQTEYYQDWSHCRPSIRQTAVHQRDLGNGRVCVEIPGEPVCWIFSKTNPCINSSAKVVDNNTSRSKIHSNVTEGLESVSQRLAQERKTSISGVMYLVEVHFMLKLITGDPTIVPLRRHMFGELSRTLQGCKILNDENVVPTLLAEAKLAFTPPPLPPTVVTTSPSVLTASLPSINENTLYREDAPPDPPSIVQTASVESLHLFDDEPGKDSASEPRCPAEPQTEADMISRVKAALWALGHIGSTDNGFETLQQNDPGFVAWCVQKATHDSNFSIRSVCFSALGLLSRADKCKPILDDLGWDYSTNHSCAVAIPNDISIMYKPLVDAGAPDVPNSTPTHITDFGASPTKLQINRAYLYTLMTGVSDFRKKDLYCDVLECIAKMPGHILYRETKGRLAQLHASHAEIFTHRELYIATQHVLLLFSFNLAIRRHVLGLFHADARLQKDSLAVKKKAAAAATVAP